MNAQAELNFEIADPSVKTLVDMVRTLLKNGKWWMPWEICDEIKLNLGIRVSDSSITARLRDLRKPEHGAHIIEIRRRNGSKAFEYRMEQ